MKCNFKFVIKGDDKVYCQLKSYNYGFCDDNECIFKNIIKELKPSFINFTEREEL
jgi:hypothetical protein